MIINTKRHLNKKDYKLLLRLVLLSILISIVELVGISVVVPFLTLALNPELLISNYYYATLYDFFSFDSEIFFIIVLGCFLIGFYLLRAIVNVFFNYKVAKSFINRIKEKSKGHKVFSSIKPGEQFIKLLKDELTNFLGGKDYIENFCKKRPSTILLSGLQGSGKTTTSVKLAYFL